MDGWTYAYLEYTGLPVLGAALLDARPAFVFAADGSRILWANAAGSALLGEPSIEKTLRRTFSDLNPIRTQVAKLARTLSADTARLELLTLGEGLSLATIPAVCRRLKLAGGRRGILAIAGATAEQPLADRARTLVHALATDEAAAAVATSDGRVIAAAGDVPHRDIRSVVREAPAERRWFGTMIEGRAAAAACFTAEGDDFYLVAIAAGGVAAQESPDEDVDVPDEMPVEAMFAGDADQGDQDAEAPALQESAATEPVASAPAPIEAKVAPAPETPPGPDTAPEPVTAAPAIAEQASTTEPTETPPKPVRHEDPDSEARRSIEEGPMRLVAAARESARSNVVRLPPTERHRPEPETLTGVEREAFRRIAEVLKAPAGEDEADDDLHATPAKPTAAREQAPDFDARLLDRLPVGIIIFRDRRTLFANKTLVEMLGYQTYEAFLAAGGAEALFPGSDDIAANIAEAGGSVAAVRSNGSAMTVTARLHAVPFAGATALMLTLTQAPAEADDALAATLARSEAKANELAAILDTATDGVVVIDGRGKIGSLNRAAEALFGINAPEYVGRYFTDLLADESQKPALDYLDGLAANGVASVLNDGREVIGRVPQGGLIPLFMTMGRIAGTDKFCAVLRDITHWKNVEEELVAARRTAEAANQQKSDFLAKISHEIRTPLNAIIGFSEVMMEERFGQIGNQRYRDYLRDIHVSGAHLMSLINDLLDLSKIEAGKLDLSFESVAINAGIQECVALMQPQANRERIIIRTSLASELPNVVADPRSLRQILLNLLSNAIKFTRAGGQVIVSTSLDDSGEVTMRIRDTGIGMSEKDIETALKPFRQVALSRDDRDHGTGLGLPLTKALVEANRASFAIESSPNQGTLVKVTFPTTRVLAG